MSITVKSIRESVGCAQIDVAQVELPMTYVEENAEGLPVFQFSNGVQFPMRELGAGYLHERFKHVPYADLTRMLRNRRYDELAAITAQSTLKLVAALYHGAIVGLMSHYVPVPHARLLDIVESANLGDDIRRWHLTETGLRLDIMVRAAGVQPEGSGKLLTALSISNGHSGHYALRYRLVVRVDDYEWSIPLTTRRRHLSKVGIALDQIKIAAKDVEDIRMEDRLRATPIDEVKNIIGTISTTVRQERLVMQVLDTNPTNAAEFIASMGVYASTVGYGAAVRGLIDPILNKIAGCAS